jgi:hypothetical protein
MCTIKIKAVVGIDDDGDNHSEQLIVVGTVEDCSSLKVALFDGGAPPQGAHISDGAASVTATILPDGVGAQGVSPSGNEHVFTATFTTADTTLVRGRCGSRRKLGVLAVCDKDEKCRDSIGWEQPIDCVTDCPVVTITPSVSDCAGQTRNVSLSLVANPLSGGLAADVDFGDGSSTEPVSFAAVPQTTVGSAATGHSYAAPATGTSTFQITVTIHGRPECVTTADVTVDACPAAPPPGRCPVDQVTLVVDSNGTDVTAQVANGQCLPPGRYRVRAHIVPPHATTAFTWNVDGSAAVVGHRGVVAIQGAQLTIDLTTQSRSISVIAAGCASNGVDLHPCKPPCCPDLTGLTASCMPRCPPSTSVTLTATGTDMRCAEAFDWEFGDGAVAETTVPTATHAYPRLGQFQAAVTITRPRECGRPRTQRRTVTVAPCPPSCFCAFLAIASAFLLLAFVTLMPLIACASDPATKQALIITLGVVVILMAIAMLWWFIDPCCRPTQCELLRILVWVFSWALMIVGVIVLFCTLPAIPFGLGYAIAQQTFLGMMNNAGCGQAPIVLSWPFPACR